MQLRKLNRNELKYLAIVAMLIDHIAWGFVPLGSAAGQIMHFIGRLTGPTMAFFLAEGYLHTHDRKRYALRLALFALISWPAFSWFEKGAPFTLNFSVIYTLFLGFLAILLWDRAPVARGWKLVGLAGLCLLSMPGDWGPFDVLWPVFLWQFRDDPARKWRSFWIIAAAAVFSCIHWSRPLWTSIWVLGILAVPPLLQFCYNGEPGSRHPFHKWVFYVFYPLHLVVLAIIRWGI